MCYRPISNTFCEIDLPKYIANSVTLNIQLSILIAFRRKGFTGKDYTIDKRSKFRLKCSVTNTECISVLGTV